MEKDTLWSKIQSLYSRRPSRMERPLRIDILFAITVLLAGTILLIALINYFINSKEIRGIAFDLIDRVNDTVISKTVNYLEPASIMAEISCKIVEKDRSMLRDLSRLDSLMIEALKKFPQLNSMFYGDEQGNFLMAKKFPNGSIDTKKIRRSAAKPFVSWQRRPPSGAAKKIEKKYKVKYDPRPRPWYKGAGSSGKIFWTDMYIYFTDKKLGITVGHPIYSPKKKLLGVLGADIHLDALSGFLEKIRVSENGDVIIINNKNEIVAYRDKSFILKKEGTAPSNQKLSLVNIREMKLPHIVRSFEEYSKTGSNKKFTFSHNGTMYIASYTPFPASFQKDWKIAVIVPEDDFIGQLKTNNIITLLITIFILGLSIVIARKLSQSISRPIVALTEEIKGIKELELDGVVIIDSPIKEIRLMNDGLQAMKKGLQSFKKYVPETLVRQLVETGIEAQLGGKKEELTIMFSDIESFVAISDKLTPEKLMKHLSEYMDELSTIIKECKGTVDKFIGDAIMAFWGAPVPNKEHTYYACKAAVLCRKRLAELNEKWKAEGKPEMNTRFGVHTDKIVVGNMGSRERMNYTVIGDGVNLASRLEGVNKVYNTRIIISESTYNKIKKKFICRPLDFVIVKGTHKPIKIFELIDIREGDYDKDIYAMTIDFQTAHEFFLDKKWDKAIEILTPLSKQFPHDGIIKNFIKKCRKLKKNPPTGKEWFARELFSK
ncbi:MAG: hypothetical protein GY754_46395 [bacterium]|nr:hypothetical protein [bacterium]